MVGPRKRSAYATPGKNKVDVLIALDGTADDARLRRLRETVDLEVRRVIGSTVVATIDPGSLDALRSATGVRAVEVATSTRLH